AVADAVERVVRAALVADVEAEAEAIAEPAAAAEADAVDLAVAAADRRLRAKLLVLAEQILVGEAGADGDAERGVDRRGRNQADRHRVVVERAVVPVGEVVVVLQPDRAAERAEHGVDRELWHEQRAAAD